MDRISDSGSDDYGSTPYGDTNKIPNSFILNGLGILFTCFCLQNCLFIAKFVKVIFSIEAREVECKILNLERKCRKLQHVL